MSNHHQPPKRTAAVTGCLSAIVLFNGALCAEPSKSENEKMGIPEGVELDDKGELVGADSHIESFKKSHGFFFEAVKPGNGGPAPGSAPNPNSDASPPDPAKAAFEDGRAAALATMTPKLPPGVLGAAASDQQ